MRLSPILFAALLSPVAWAEEPKPVPVGVAFSLGAGSAYGFFGGRVELHLGHAALFGFYGANVLQGETAQGGVAGGGARWFGGFRQGFFVSGQVAHSAAASGRINDQGGYFREEAITYGVTAGWRWLVATHGFVEAGAGALYRDVSNTGTYRNTGADRRFWPDLDLGVGLTF